MASAQVLPNTSRKEHLEAGKRRLEEFRKKKAAEKAKKASSTSQFQAGTDSVNGKQPLDIEQVRVTDSDGVGTSDAIGGAVMELPRVVIDNENIAVESAEYSGLNLLKDMQVKSTLLSNNYNAFFPDPVQEHAKDQESVMFDKSSIGNLVDISYSDQANMKNDDFGFYAGSQERFAQGAMSNLPFELQRDTNQGMEQNRVQSSFYEMGEARSEENNGSSKGFSISNPVTSNVSVANVSFGDSSSILPQHKSAFVSTPSNDSRSFSYEDSVGIPTKGTGYLGEAWHHKLGSSESNGSVFSNRWEHNFGSFAGNASDVSSAPLKPSDSLNSRNYPNHVPQYLDMTDTSIRRSRPSFLDSLNIPKASASSFSHTQLENSSFMSNNSKVPSMDIQVSSLQKSFLDTVEPSSELRMLNEPASLYHSMILSDSNTDGVNQLSNGVNEYNMERSHECHSQKQKEDFAALEQHIEDLTQEKFALQRALEASRTLSESLAAENSALTDSYNQQGGVVNQLRSDMEKLQEEIKTYLVELESTKVGYENIELECNAADERAKLLASEVIGLEEKALRLRSSELKLERHLEKSETEIASYKKKMSSLERERQDMQFTIDALQEEKKLLQSKLRRASGSAKSIDDINDLSKKKDVSTSTEDLVHGSSENMGTSNLKILSSTSLRVSDISDSPPQTENGISSFEGSSVNIPSDQMRMIQNINALISELALEKQELMQALINESSNTCDLKELNKELSRKLEIQTQRLELLTAQSMASENAPLRQDSSTVQEDAAYADEGDEVVERVLGWIMKLFPGGPTRRRTSKLL